MRILQLSLNNFFSFKSINFDFRDQSELVFISGINGAGKSALFVEAIPWAIYGNTIREKVYGSTSREFNKDDVINESAGKDCQVSVEFSVENRIYCVLRYRNHSAYGNTVSLYEQHSDGSYNSDGIISGESTKETNQKIVDLIGLNYSAYCNAVVYGQGTIKRFTQCTDAERRKILENFLQLEIYTKAREIAKNDWKKLTEEISQIQNERDVCDARLSEVEVQCTRAKSQVTEKQSNFESYDASVKLGIKSTNNRLLAIKKEQKHITSTLADVKDNRTSVESIIEELQRIHQGKPLLEDVISEIATKKAQFNSNAQSVHRGETKLEKFNVGDECPSCFRQLRKTDLTRYQAVLSKEIKQCRRDNTALDTKLKTLNEFRDSLQELKDKETAMAQSSQELDRKHVKGEASRKSLEEEAKRLQAEIANSEDRSGNLRADVETAKTEVARLQKRLSILTKVCEVKDKLIHLTQLEADEAKFWIDGFSAKGVKDLIFAQSLGFLNDQLLRYSNAIAGGEIVVEINRDLSVKVDITEGAKRYQTASGGQAKRIDLMIGLALQRLVEIGWQDVNVKFIDEFDASLDKAGVDGFISLLREEAKSKGAIFIISHNDYLAEQIDNVIQVEKVNGESVITSG